MAISALLIASLVLADAVTVGPTYAIAEPDALTEIETRAASVDWDAALASRDISAVASLPLPQASENRTRRITPDYTLEFDIPGPDGRVLYPKGFRFNPLDYLSLPFRIFVIGAADLNWAVTELEPADRVILADGDVLLAAEHLGRPVFGLDERTRSRLQIEVTPSRIEQDGHELVITEFVPEPMP